MRASLLPRSRPDLRAGCLPHFAVVVACLLLMSGVALAGFKASRAPAPLAAPLAASRLAATGCEVDVRINGVQQWIEKPAEFCGITSSPSPSASPSAVPSASPSVAPSPSPVPSPSPSSAPSPSASSSPSPGPSPVASPSPTPSPSAAPSATPSPTSSPSPTPTGSLIVGSGGYATINAAIAAATTGQTIRIKAGTYAEQVSVTKTLSLVAFGDGVVAVDGGCARLFGITITANDVRISNLSVRRTNDAGISIGVNGNSAHPARAVIDGNTVQDFDCNNGPNDEAEAGVACWYCGPGQTITNNTITRRVTLNGGNNVGGNSNGIYFKGSSAQPTGGGHLIDHNTIKGGYDCIGSQLEDDPRGGFDRNTTISFNTIDTCYDDGVQVEGGTLNIHVSDNTITHAASGTANAPNLTGPIYFERNVITQGTPGFYQTLNCFKIGNGGSGTAYYTANRCYLPTGGANGWSQTNSQVTSIVARGNQIHTSRYVIEINSPAAGATFSFDGDCLWTADATRFVEMPNGRWLTLAAWRAASGQETNGTQSAACGT